MDEGLKSAIQHHQAGRLDQAAEAYRAVLAQRPGNAEALHLLGLIHLQQGDLAEAKALITKAVKRKPQAAIFHNHLGLALRGLGELAEARKAFSRALSLDRRLTEAGNNLGLVLNEMGQVEEACAAFESVLADRPDYSSALANLGALERRRGHLERAETLLKKARDADPKHAASAVNLALVYKTGERFAEAEKILHDLLKDSPDHPEAHVNLAFLLMAQGRYREAAPHFEYRMDRQILGHAFQQGFALWQGEDMTGKTLLLHAEQGLGDTLHLVRFLPQLAAKGIKPLLIAQHALCPLLQRLDGLTGLFSFEAAGAARADAWLPLMSLLDRLAIEGPQPPSTFPYLKADAEKVAAWKKRLSPATHKAGLNVGLAWAGNPTHVNDQARSLPLEALRPLLELKGARFIALQFDGAAAEIAKRDLPIASYADEIKDFDDSAALISALDLVITIDSAPLHLAAGLGVETWGLIAKPADWRWGLDGETSPWYPSLRLFRQNQPGAWDEPLTRAHAALKARLTT